MKNENYLYSKTNKFTVKNYIKSGDHRVYYRYKQREGATKNVMIIHGGPGSTMSNDHMRYFSPKKYNIAQFDHRCCGKSFNQNENFLHEVGVRQIVEDIEDIRKALNIEKIILFSLSWGGTIALAYAGIYPQNVEAVIMQSPLVLETYNRNWLFSENGIAAELPEAKTFLNDFKKSNFIENMLEKKCSKSAYNWVAWRSLIAGKDKPEELTPALHKGSILAVHYFYNDVFLQNDFEKVISQIPAEVPVHSLHGTNDKAVAPETVSYLQQTLANNNIYVLDGLGHSAFNSLPWNKAITELTDMVA